MPDGRIDLDCLEHLLLLNPERAVRLAVRTVVADMNIHRETASRYLRDHGEYLAEQHRRPLLIQLPARELLLRRRFDQEAATLAELRAKTKRKM